MAFSYSAMARGSSTFDRPEVISIATSAPKRVAEEQPAAGPSIDVETEAIAAPSDAPVPVVDNAGSAPETGSSGSASSSRSSIQHLILDAGPLLSLTPLRHLATAFHTTPMVLAELRDPKAREHWERLGLAGVDVRVEHPTADSMAKVVAFAKKTGDFAVLSQTDLSVAALTYQYEALVNGVEGIRTEPGQKIKKKTVETEPTVNDVVADRTETSDGQNDGSQEIVKSQEGTEEGEDVIRVEEITRSIDQVLLNNGETAEGSSAQSTDVSVDHDPVQPQVGTADTGENDQVQDIDDESDGGEWINPSNLTTHRSRDLGLITPSGSNQAKPPAVACMTGDFAVQNILLGMGLGLVGEGGKKISKVKSWVLRCHACFKICKDPSKRFCPSCGNATLLRTTVSTDAKTGQQSVHLKKNFQYHTRGTKYSIPDPKMGRAKGQQKGGSGLILREDQVEWSDAVRQQDRVRAKEDRRAAKGALEGWNDPDWMPEIITVGMSGKGRSGGRDMPTIGHGRKNPNQARRKR
ncbi:hypothetical protein IAU60_000137 [Kwoniella sp. DSM 27419]